MKHRLSVILIVLALLAWNSPAGADVFWRWRTGSGRSVLENTPGWQRVYRSTLRINGGRAQLEVLQCQAPLAAVMARLQNAFPAARPDAAFLRGESGVRGLVVTGDTVTRFLALDLGAPDETVLFALTQSAADYTLSLQPPPAGALESVPAYPGSTATAFLADEETTAQLFLFSAGAPAEDVRSFYAAAFDHAGYRRIAAGGGLTDLALYQKGPELCCLLIRDAPPQACAITVLHKRLRKE